MTGQSPLRGLTAAEATANFAANLSAMRCPNTHRNAVPVEDLMGEVVAALCPDCDQQLPVAWLSSIPPLPPFVPDPRLTARIKE